MTVRELRKKLGWTQQRLAWEAGVNIVSVARWETGTRKTTPEITPEMVTRLTEIAQKHGIDGFKPDCPCCRRPL